MTQYPLFFSATAHSSGGTARPWESKSNGISLTCAIPPEFAGPGGGLSPEDLFAQAITNCFLATFQVYVEKSKLSFFDLKIRTELKVDLDENKQPVMKEADFHATILGGSSPERLRTLAEKALKSGFILNSVKTKLNLELKFED